MCTLYGTFSLHFVRVVRITEKAVLLNSFSLPSQIQFLTYLLPYEFLFDCEKHGIIIIWMEKSEFWSMFVNPQAVVCINCYLIVDA